MIGQLGAGFNVPEGKRFYIIQEGDSKVLEIRTIVDLPSGKKYLVDIKKGVSAYVSKEEFYFVPEGFKLLRVD